MSARPGIRRNIYVVDKKRFIAAIAIFILAILALVLLCLNLSKTTGQYTAHQFSADHLLMYFEVEKDMGVPWQYLAAIDLAESIPPNQVTKERSSVIALHLTGLERDNELSLYLAAYRNDKAFIRRVKNELERLSDLKAIYQDKIFPIPAGEEYSYENGYGDERTYGGERSHEGIDIMAEKGVPVVSVCDGTIEKTGWNELGGWRIGIRGKDGIYYYYAHLSRYEGEPKEGDKVRKGQVIGYVGDSGYGPIGTTGQFLPHLHFGMYSGKGKLKAFNPYPFLKAWES